MTDKRFLELEITAWLASPERKRQINGELYYDGNRRCLAGSAWPWMTTAMW